MLFDLATLAIELIFATLFAASLWTYLRRREPVSRDVTLVFSSVTGLLVVEVVERVTGGAPTWLSLAATLLFLAQPVFTLRLSSRARRLPRAAMWGVVTIYAASIVPLVVLDAEQRPAWVVVPPLIGFVLIEAVAGWNLLAEGLARSASARARLIIAALATGLWGLALLSIVAPVVAPAAADVARGVTLSLGLFAALGYLVAFLPPRWLVRLWRATGAFDFTERAIAGDASASPAALWALLVDTAHEITGATAALVLRADPERGGVVVAHHGASLDRLDPAALAEVERAASQRAQVPLADWPQLASILGAAPGSVLAAVNLDAGAEHVRLAWVSPSWNLFGADDRALLDVIGRRAVVFAERASVVATQASLNERLAATNEALQNASQAKSDFLASMSHELRTPLSAIIGFASLMREEPGTESVTVPREWVEHVHISGQHLLSLINDVLDLSKVEAGRLELQVERVDLQVAIAELLGGLRPLAERKGVALVQDVHAAEAAADRGRLRQMLYNLVSNAIKFTPAGGSVTVSATEAGGEVRLAVVDTGTGIAPEDQERVFLEFQQAGDAAQRHEGTGLGLPLTRRLAEAHGGRVELESEVGRGSRFTIVLSTSAPEGLQVEAPTAADTDGYRRAAPTPGEEILLIEDDPSAVRLLRTYLEEAGHRVRVESDGLSGIAAARDSRPAAIILDVLLPGTDGWEVLRELKADAGLRDIPVVVVTVVDERQLAMTLGAVDYFLKPVQREALLARLERLTFTTKVRQRPITILVVDDEASARTATAAILEPAGFDVALASSGREGLDRARMGDVDLVILDLLMPEMDGFEVIAELAADPRTAYIPILILTAHDLSDVEKQRLNGQITGIIAKQEPDLADALRGWLARVVADPGSPTA